MQTVILACQIISFEKKLAVFILHLPSASAGLASGDELSWPQSTPVRIWTTRSRLSDTRSASLSPVSSLWATPRPDWLVMTVTFKYSQEERTWANKRVNNPDKQETPHNAYSKDLFKTCGGFGGTSGCNANNWVGDRWSSFKLSTFRQTSWCNKSLFLCDYVFLSHTQTVIYRNLLLRNREKLPRKPPTRNEKWDITNHNGKTHLWHSPLAL